MPIIRGSTSRGAHVRALWNLLGDLAELHAGTDKGVRIRTYRAMLERAYPGECSGVTDSDIEQFLAEEDGLPIDS